MKTLLTFLTILVLATQAIAQVTFTGKAIDDYSKLRKMINDSSFDSKQIDSSHYNISALKSFVESKIDSIKKRGVKVSAVDPNSISGLGDVINPTFAIDALGTFVADRIREEANIAYLNRFTEFINDSSNLELKLLLPETRTKLAEVQNEIYDYKNYFPSLRNHIKADFENLPANLITIFENPKTFKSDFWSKTKITSDNKPYFVLFLDILISFKDSQKPIVFLERVRDRRTFKDLSKKSGTEKELIFLITDLAFHSNPENPANDLPKVTEDLENVECFVQLLLASKNNKSSNLKSGKLEPTQVTDNLIKPLVKLIKAVTNPQEKDKPLAFISTFAELTKSVATIIPKSNIKYLIGPSQIVKGIKTKDYALAVTGVINLADEWVNDRKNNKADLDKFRKYLTFMVNITNAKDGNDMLVALQAAALPVRAYQMKRHNTFTWSVGALGGLGYREINKNVAVYAPIGMDFTWGLRHKLPLLGSIGVFVPLIDVSAVTALRLLGNKDALPSLVWGNVFAPGVFLNLGIRNQPITISIGGQYGPGLIEIKNNQAIIGERAETFIIGASFDIPIFKILDRK